MLIIAPLHSTILIGLVGFWSKNFKEEWPMYVIITLSWGKFLHYCQLVSCILRNSNSIQTPAASSLFNVLFQLRSINSNHVNRSDDKPLNHRNKTQLF